MKSEKKILVWVLVASVISIGFLYAYRYLNAWVSPAGKIVTVGLMLDGDESTPYSNNFIRAMETLENTYGDRIVVIIKYNVPYEDAGTVVDSLVDSGCDIIFANSYGYCESVKDAASRHPGVQFCQATGDNAGSNPVLENYHTFMGEIYEGRYISGMIAGMKLQELIDAGMISSDQALIGYVGAYPYPEVISGYTAFFLGARQTCPTALMRVRYSYTWDSYMKEKELTEKLIDEGCIIISQHSDTIGPAVTCENSKSGHPVYHVGYNQDMIDVAPTTSLAGTRINWTPYIVDAVRAVMNDQKIENVVSAHIHGNDAGAGFEKGWVEMLELNSAIAPAGSTEFVERTISDFKNGRVHVFSGDYVGINPEDPSDVIDLNSEFFENSDSSAPAFHYVLQDVITVEE